MNLGDVEDVFDDVVVDVYVGAIDDTLDDEVVDIDVIDAMLL